jgi:hypothetical protein
MERTSIQLQGYNGKAFLLKREHMGSVLSVYIVYQKDMDGFVQHLEPRACVGKNSVVIPPHMRSVNKEEHPTWVSVDPIVYTMLLFTSSSVEFMLYITSLAVVLLILMGRSSVLFLIIIRRGVPY